jgi:hypothetical protein
MVSEPVQIRGNRLDENGELSASDLARLGPVPSGAAALAGIAVGSLLFTWLLIYLAIYLPRGMIG